MATQDTSSDSLTIIGISLGQEVCAVSAFQAGEIIDTCKRLPTLCTFTPQKVYYDVDALKHSLNNISNSIYEFIDLLGRKYDDPLVQKWAKHCTYNIIKINKNDIGIEIKQEPNKKSKIYSLTDIVSGFLQNTIKKCLDQTGCSESHIIISIPSSFNTDQKSALLDTAKLADIKTVRSVQLVTSCLAASVYGLYQNKMKNNDNNNEKNYFVADISHIGLCLATINLKRRSFDDIINIKSNIGYNENEYVCSKFRSSVLLYMLKSFIDGYNSSLGYAQNLDCNNLIDTYKSLQCLGVIEYNNDDIKEALRTRFRAWNLRNYILSHLHDQYQEEAQIQYDKFYKEFSMQLIVTQRMFKKIGLDEFIRNVGELLRQFMIHIDAAQVDECILVGNNLHFTPQLVELFKEYFDNVESYDRTYISRGCAVIGGVMYDNRLRLVVYGYVREYGNHIPHEITKTICIWYPTTFIHNWIVNISDIN